jgi:hypothetical protein
MKKIILPLIIVLALASALLLFSKPKAEKVYECSEGETCGKNISEVLSSDESEISFNEHIINIIDDYENDGSYPYSWVSGYKGVSRDLYYHGEKIANANPDSSHSTYCCGLTFEVYFRSIMEYNKGQGYPQDLNGMKVEDFDDFISLWFVQEVKGDGPGLALEAYGLGQKIEKMKDVKKGDFVQIWRTSGSGHSVIFINWTVNEEGDTTGMRYWSTQPGTNGANYNTEYFSGFGGKVDRSVTHYSRAFAPEDFIEQ